MPDRTLGESLPPSCVALLERVGFAGLDRAAFMRSTGNTVHWGGDVRVERFAEGRHGLQVARGDLDELLSREAAGAGADVRLGANVTAIERGERTRVSFEHQGESQTVDADWVLDCTGRTGVVARNGWRQNEKAARTTALVGLWERASWPTDDPSHTIVESTSDSWAWSVPVTERRRFVTLMVDPSLTQLATKTGMDDAYAAQLARTRVMSALVKDASRVAPVFAVDASPYSARVYGEQGALLVGDAGSFVDPLSSFGIKKAVASAWLASVVVHTSLGQPDMTTPALELFNERERQMFVALQRASAEMARDAASASPGEFWSARSAVPDDPALAAEPDATLLRQDPDVLGAFEQIRAAEKLTLRQGRSVRFEKRPAVRENRVVLKSQLVVPAFPGGVRYIRNVDLLRLGELAPQYEQVPDLFAAYNRVEPPVPLPDFLGALSVLVGKKILEWRVA